MIKERRSNFEALRLLAIFFITVHHFMYYGINSINGYPHGASRTLMTILFLSQGKVGVTLFFSITVYFLCTSEASLHRSFKKAWSLEKTLLFWSIILGAFSLFMGLYKNLNQKNTIKTVISFFLPTTSNCWWFVTSYMGFLLISPFLIKGISVLPQKWHLTLCIFLLGIEFASHLPILKQSVAVTGGLLNTEFIILFVVIAYIKRFHSGVFTKRTIGILALLIGYSWIIVRALMGKQEFGIFDIGVLCESFGWFVIFNNLQFRSKSINFLASHVFAIYLITEFPGLRMSIWTHVLKPVSFLYGSWWMLLYGLLAVTVICFICIGLDTIKSFLFKFIFDRNPERWFEILWNKTNSLLSK
ncbi:acyltransferase [Bifidobacterium sp. ESL0745]|uniref:acyltransferase family protein n=1 Tax=Bifidobacterium sp. ESL0745 TaxID=2983226 RepID=UPI0023FA02F4|nr:acyltransferase [Bifidobacterium sp. ESL0745]MDF7665582.1 acyltransferase [Bifidobacterium sp. ESL0745]